MEYKGLRLDEASDEVIKKKLVDVGGEGGIIAVDKWGNVHLTFNTSGMYRGYATEKGEIKVEIF